MGTLLLVALASLPPAAAAPIDPPTEVLLGTAPDDEAVVVDAAAVLLLPLSVVSSLPAEVPGALAAPPALPSWLTLTLRIASRIPSCKSDSSHDSCFTLSLSHTKPMHG